MTLRDVGIYIEDKRLLLETPQKFARRISDPGVMRFGNHRDSQSTQLLLVKPGKFTLWDNGKGDRRLEENAKFRESLDPLLLRRVRPGHNERRFYALTVTVDLFGNVVLLRHWGRIGTGGKQRADRHSDFAGAAESLKRIARKKRRRGYVDFGLSTNT